MSAPTRYEQWTGALTSVGVPAHTGRSKGLIAQKAAAMARAHLSRLSLVVPAANEQGGNIPEIAGIQPAGAACLSPERGFSAASNAPGEKPPRCNPRNPQETVPGPVPDLAGNEIEAVDAGPVVVPIAANMWAWVPLPIELPFRQARETFERAYFERLLAHEGGSRSRVAEKTGMDRSHLYRKLKALGIKAGKDDESA